MIKFGSDSFRNFATLVSSTYQDVIKIDSRTAVVSNSYWPHFSAFTDYDNVLPADVCSTVGINIAPSKIKAILTLDRIFSSQRQSVQNIFAPSSRLKQHARVANRKSSDGF
jgi:hypothetical protein